MSLDYQRRSTRERRPSVGRRGAECDHSLLDLHKIKISQIISGLEENNSNGQCTGFHLATKVWGGSAINECTWDMNQQLAMKVKL